MSQLLTNIQMVDLRRMTSKQWELLWHAKTNETEGAMVFGKNMVAVNILHRRGFIRKELDTDGSCHIWLSDAEDEALRRNNKSRAKQFQRLLPVAG